jgi:hypothetical protein
MSRPRGTELPSLGKGSDCVKKRAKIYSGVHAAMGEWLHFGLCAQCCGRPIWRTGSNCCRVHIDVRTTYNERYKQKAFELVARGGLIECRGCGESDPIVLTIAHLNNDGYKDRTKTRGAGMPFYTRIANGKRVIDDLTIECCNCQARSRAHFTAAVLEGRRKQSPAWRPDRHALPSVACPSPLEDGRATATEEA